VSTVRHVLRLRLIVSHTLIAHTHIHRLIVHTSTRELSTMRKRWQSHEIQSQVSCYCIMWVMCTEHTCANSIERRSSHVSLPARSRPPHCSSALLTLHNVVLTNVQTPCATCKPLLTSPQEQEGAMSDECVKCAHTMARMCGQ
jgi:hypothetical protein